jgi:hypothetical protein
VGVAGAGIIGGIAEPARALRRQRARLAELEEALRVTAITSEEVAVVAGLSGFEDPVAAPRRDALVGAAGSLAEISRRAVRVLVAGARIGRRVAVAAETRGALRA